MSWNTQTKIDVRFADVDALGHINNAKYFTYLEQGRLAYFKKLSQLDLTRLGSNPGPGVILASIRCDFLAPAFMDEVLIVKIRTREIKRSSFVMEYEICEEVSQRMVAKAESVQVYFDYQKQKSLEIPEDLRKKFEEIEGRKI